MFSEPPPRMSFRGQIDRAIDWCADKDIPAWIKRDKYGTWYAVAELRDQYGIFRAEVPVMEKEDITRRLDCAIHAAWSDRHAAFRQAQGPGHLPVNEPPEKEQPDMQKLLLLSFAFIAFASLTFACDTTGRGCFPPPVPAPGPIVGAGLGYLALAGGYYVVRRWRNRGR